MGRVTAQVIIMLSGAALIVVGVVLVVLQFQHQLSMPDFVPRTRSVRVQPTGAFDIKATHAGLVLVAIGAFLEAVGYMATVPWRKS